jgi:hypothetical protein
MEEFTDYLYSPICREALTQQTHSTLMKPSVVEWLAAHEKRAEPRHAAPVRLSKQPRGTKGGDNKIDRRWEPKVRIQLPPAASPQTFSPSR